MLTLMLLRHAKSSWGEGGLADRERPLSGRGRRAAQAMGRAIASLKPVPELTLCSPARRATETWEIANEEIPSSVPVQIDEQLYDFGNGEAVLACVKARAGEARCLLAVGHNPAFHELAKRLTGTGSDALRAKLIEKFPTGALAVIAFEAETWSGVADGAGELKRFIRPKDILADAGD